ncbi:hypothetical protein N7523_001141 [Penicillium sp. IBT 18751x]|nr:hypothetical protein N7523_001141 [Penicillium sp. IBT 18751x]
MAPTSSKKRKPGRICQYGADAANFGDTKQRNFIIPQKLGDDLVNQLYANSMAEAHLEPPCKSVTAHPHIKVPAGLNASSRISSESDSSCTLTGCIPTPPARRGNHDNASQTLASSVAAELDPSFHCRNCSYMKPEYQEHANIFGVDDLCKVRAIVQLAGKYGRVAHMGILDPSYKFFVNKAGTGALSFKVENRVAVVGGDPLCETEMIAHLLTEFAAYRRQHHWGLAFMGASESFARSYAQAQGWATLRFGTERVLNPQTNDVLLGHSGKRIAVQSRQLLHLQKGGITIGVYVPATHGANPQLQTDLVAIYESWRADRNRSGAPQAFITVYDPFSLPALMTFVYTRGPDGHPNGFAALRRLGTVGYHVDPCIAMPGSARGISDLLLVAVMSLLNRIGVSYLGFGFEPIQEIPQGNITGMSLPLGRVTRILYRHMFHRLDICGKKPYHDKFRPDLPQDSALYIIIPKGIPGLHNLLAIMHMANISLRKVLRADIRAWVPRGRIKSPPKASPDIRDAEEHRNVRNSY